MTKRIEIKNKIEHYEAQHHHVSRKMAESLCTVEACKTELEVVEIILKALRGEMKNVKT